MLPKRTYCLKVQATNGMQTRALSLDNTGKNLTVSWAAGEKLGVHAWCDNGLGELTANYIGAITANEDGNPTTFIGDVEEAPYYDYITEGTELVFTFPNSSADGYVFQYKDGQDGTLEKIATTFDYASATATVKELSKEDDGDKLYIMLEGGNKINFRNHTAITAFTCLDEQGDTLLPSYFEVNGKGLVEEYDLFVNDYLCFLDDDTTPQYGHGLKVNTPTYPKTVYVAMLNKYNSKQEYTFFVSARKKGDSTVKSYKKKMKANLKPGIFYATTLQLKQVSNFNEDI